MSVGGPSGEVARDPAYPSPPPDLHSGLRSSLSWASRQLCSAGSLESVFVCLSSAWPPMVSGRMGTLLSSTCSQPHRKAQVSHQRGLRTVTGVEPSQA